MMMFKKEKIRLLILSLTLSLVFVACSPADDTNDTNQQTNPVEENVDTPEESDDISNENPSEPEEPQIEGDFTMMEAIDGFFEKYPTGQIEDIEFDHKGQGNYQYEIQGYADGQEIELVYEAYSGELLKEETDQDQDDDDGPYLNFDNIVSLQEAYIKAIAAINDLNEDDGGRFDSWKLDMDDNVPVYSFDFDRAQGDDFEIYVHAETMEIIEIDK